MPRRCSSGPTSWSRKCAAIRCSATSPRKPRTAACAPRSTSIASAPASSASASRPSTTRLNDAFAQRQISTIYGQANQYRVVLEAMPMYQRDPSILVKLYVPGAASTPGSPAGQVPHLRCRHADADHRAVGDLASGAISGGLAQLQSRARRGARRCRGGGQEDRSPHRHARQHRRHICRRCGRILKIAGGTAMADPGGAGHDLHRARRAL